MPAVAASPAPANVEVVRLAPDTPLVPDDLLSPPWRSDSRGMLRDLAAFLLDRHLRRLARIRQPIDLRLASLLHRVEVSSGYLALGFARMSDYASERLGLPARRVQTLLALARRLEGLPRLAAAFEAGRVSLSQVQLLLRVVTPENEADWIARAEATTVRRLESEVRAAEMVTAAATTAASQEAATANIGEGARAPLDEDPSTAGEFIVFTAPAGVRSRWDQALDLARRSSGAGDPAWRSVEFIAAEYLSGVPDVALALAQSHAGAGGRTGGADDADSGDSAAPSGEGPGDDPASFPGDRCPSTGGPGEGADTEGVELFEEVLAALAADPEAGSRGCRASGGMPFPDDGPRVVLPESVRDDPADSVRDWDAKLHELVRLRQSVSWNLGRLLRTFAGRSLHRELGFLSFSRYCRERLGLGVRRAWQLIALDRRLFLLPGITRAYRGGVLSWVKASAIARVATERTEDQWLRLAESVTVRRLLDEVALSEAGIRPSGPPGLDPDGRVQLSAPVRPRSPSTSTATPTAASPDTTPAPESPPSDPGPPTRIRFWAPHEVASLWHQALALARHLADRPISDGECVLAMLDGFVATWSVRADPAWQRRYRIFERDGWRCRVPGCTARRNLQVHHVRFRSRGGSDDDANLAVLCATHHLQGIHRDRLRCHALPDGLLAWEFGPDPVRGPLVAYVEDVLWAAARAAVSAHTAEGVVTPGAGRESAADDGRGCVAADLG